MKPMKYEDFLAEVQSQVMEVQPWDCEAIFQPDYAGLVLDVREPAEFAAAHVKNSLLVPRGVLESAADAGYEESEPRLIQARQQEVIVICRSGRRSLLAAHTLQRMGFERVKSLKTGARGLYDAGYPLVKANGEEASEAELDALFYPTAR